MADKNMPDMVFIFDSGMRGASKVGAYSIVKESPHDVAYTRIDNGDLAKLEQALQAADTCIPHTGKINSMARSSVNEAQDILKRWRTARRPPL